MSFFIAFFRPEKTTFYEYSQLKPISYSFVYIYWWCTQNRIWHNKNTCKNNIFPNYSHIWSVQEPIICSKIESANQNPLNHTSIFKNLAILKFARLRTKFILTTEDASSFWEFFCFSQRLKHRIFQWKVQAIPVVLSQPLNHTWTSTIIIISTQM